jgi:hypothetical protein
MRRFTLFLFDETNVGMTTALFAQELYAFCKVVTTQWSP